MQAVLLLTEYGRDALILKVWPIFHVMADNQKRHILKFYNILSKN